MGLTVIALDGKSGHRISRELSPSHERHELPAPEQRRPEPTGGGV